LQQLQPQHPHLNLPMPVITKEWTDPLQTTDRIVQMAYQSVQSPQVLDVAKQIVAQLATEHVGNKTASTLSEIAAVHNYIARNVRYTRDPFGVEVVYDPRAMIDRINKHGKFAEDCDSIALLTAVLLAAIGVLTRIAIVGFFADKPNEYQHILCQAAIPGIGWVVVDPSMEHRIVEILSKVKHIKYYDLWRKGE
jgi:transglutaminase-like putative cysteine protease